MRNIKFSRVTEGKGASIPGTVLDNFLKFNKVTIICSPDVFDLNALLGQVRAQVVANGCKATYIKATAGGCAEKRAARIMKGIGDSSDFLFVELPETFLHPATQEDLMAAMQAAENKKVVITTHSPVMIGNHWNSVIELYELKCNRKVWKDL